MNQDQQNQINSKHKNILENGQWINDPQIKEKLAQNLTAYLAMNEAFQSIAARVHLIRNAQNTLDLKYYIWSNDFIGNLLLDELLQAADRGIKIRLLIDDQNGVSLDEHLKHISGHPNIQIKIYNPYKFRNFRAIDYVIRGKQINHRMHNKLTIADDVIAVTGGRNIGSEYFEASDHFQFTDMDILFFGHVVRDAKAAYLQFWEHPLSVPVIDIMGTGTAEQLQQLRDEYIELAKKNIQIDYKVDTEQKKLENLLQKTILNWAPASFLADSPEKTLGQAKGHELIYEQIMQEMGTPKHQLDLISAYFVPTKEIDYLSKLPAQNVKVRILTNSFLANNVAMVHAFYQKYRLRLLKSGVKLYEFKSLIEREDLTWYERMTGNIIPKKGKDRSCLHAKFIHVDNKVFIGSFNFDPRSFELNTEVGLLIESEQLKKQITDLLDQHLYKIAYELKLNQQGKIIWLEHTDNGEIKEFNKDPKTSRFQRFMMKSTSLLPIEWMM